MFNPLFGKKRNAVYPSTYRRGLDFQSALREKFVYSTWQILQLSWIFNPLFGYDKTSGGNACLVARGQSALWKKPCRLFPRAKNWYSWIVNPLCGQMKTWSTHRVAKDLRAACSTHSSGKKTKCCIHVDLQKRSGYSIRSSGKNCLLNMANIATELDFQSALWV